MIGWFFVWMYVCRRTFFSQIATLLQSAVSVCFLRTVAHIIYVLRRQKMVEPIFEFLILKLLATFLNFFSIRCFSYSFSLILMKHGTQCANTPNCGIYSRNFDFKIFGHFLKFYMWTWFLQS